MHPSSFLFPPSLIHVITIPYRHSIYSMYRILNPIIYSCLLVLGGSRYYQPPEMTTICKIDKERSEDYVVTSKDCGRDSEEKCAGEISNFTIYVYTHA